MPVRSWMAGWKRNGWKRKGGELKNVDILKAIDEQLALRKVSWTWVVLGHAGDPQ